MNLEKLTKNTEYIKCPKCGWEYLPCEIFYPEYLLGKNLDIVKDPMTGKILSFSASKGIIPELKENYICDHCGCSFDTVVRMSFKSRVNVEEDFSEEYSTKLLITKDL